MLKGLSEEEKKKFIPNDTILLGYVGSIAHGTYRPSSDQNSIDDKDLMGVCIASKETYLGLENFKQKNVQENEWDIVIYELKKMVSLLLKNNPNVLSILWLPENLYVIKTIYGQLLIDNRNYFSSKRAYYSFTGYAYSQLRKMTCSAFKGYMGEKRKSLVNKYGYDTKNASHLIRLLRMGIEFLTDGELHVHREDNSQLVEIKQGKWNLEKVKSHAENLFNLANEAFIRSSLPDKPNHKKVEALLVDILSDFLGKNTIA